MMYTGTQMGWVVTAGALACIACVLIGIWIGYGRGFRHGSLDKYLTRKQLLTRTRPDGRRGTAVIRPRTGPPQPVLKAVLEVAHEEAGTAIMERLAPTAYLEMPDWHRDDWDLDGFLARMTAGNDRFLNELIPGGDQ